MPFWRLQNITVPLPRTAGYHNASDKIAEYHSASEKAAEYYSESDKSTEYHKVSDCHITHASDQNITL